MFLLGGIIAILVPAMKLDCQSLSSVILGITFLLLGSSFIWNKERRQQENKSGPDTLFDQQKD
jgi:membrane protein implicated in regulation of membrane protease activity